MRPSEVDWSEVERWSLVRLEWLDITEATGLSPEEAKLAVRVEYRLYYGVVLAENSPHGVETLVVALTHDEGDNHAQAGYGAYPTSVIVDFEVVERPGQKRRKKKSLTPKKAASQPEEAQCSPSS